MTDKDTPEARRRAFRVVAGAVNLKALPPARDQPQADEAKKDGFFEGVEMDMAGGTRVLAPGAPASPGTAPLEIARHLRLGEALVWWDAKAGFDLRPLAWIGGVSALVLIAITLLVPEFWAQPFEELWRPIAVMLSPMVVWLAREQFSQRAILVTDTAIVEVPRRGEPQRLQFSAVQRVRRDVLTGGVVLTGKTSKIRIPATLVERTRAAVASQRKGARALRSAAQRPDDPLHFMG